MNLHPTLYLCNRNRAVLEKLTGSQLVKKIPRILWARIFISTFKSVFHLLQTDSDQSSPCPQFQFLKIPFIIILPYTGWRKKNACFSNNCNFVYFQYKKIISTPKQPVINAVLITYIDYSITENYMGKMASLLLLTM